MGIIAYKNAQPFTRIHTYQDELYRKEEEAKELGGLSLCHVYSQEAVGAKRVDFVIECYALRARLDGEGECVERSIIAVECDGYKHHHGDPKRAAADKARDRGLAAHFDAIVRFTGSEINANAYACAKEAIAIAEAKLS